jgi:hypothetical protein
MIFAFNQEKHAKNGAAETVIAPMEYVIATPDIQDMTVLKQYALDLNTMIPQ